MTPAINPTVESRYQELERKREPFLRRARECSLLTIPALIPEQGFNESSDLPTPYQSLGARGVNNLANKLLLALLPPSSTFFRLTTSESIKQQIRQVSPEAESMFDLALSKVEQEVLKEIEHRQTRVHAAEVFKHLIVGGNILVHDAPDTIRVFSLDRYVVDRDAQGTVIEIVVKECVSLAALPEAIRAVVKATREAKASSKQDIDLYTHVKLVDDHYEVVQEVEGILLDDTRGSYVKDKLPWMALRWTRIDGQSYGRGHCEEYIGDLASLDKLEKSVLEASAIAARILFLCDPNGTTNATELNTAENGATIPGREDDVHVLQAAKYADLQITAREIDRIEQRINYAFLMNSAIQRQAERVTAEEVRYMAGELEDTLGGVYSVMATEFQLPLVKLTMGRMQKRGDLPKLPKDGVIPTIVTGLDALGRSHELMRLDQFVKGALETFGEQTFSYINVSEYLLRRAAALGIDNDNLIRSSEEVAAERQQMQRAQMMQAAVPNVAKGIADNVNQAQAAQAPNA